MNVSSPWGTDENAGKLVHGAWKGGLTEPGHGIQLRTGSHSEHLISPMGYRQGNVYGTYGIYSDDSGNRWHIGYNRKSPKGVKLIEGTLGETSNGRVLVSYRDLNKTKPGRNRFIAYSTNSGATITSYKRMAGTYRVQKCGYQIEASKRTQKIKLFYYVYELQCV